jgi:hypothetical protein
MELFVPDRAKYRTHRKERIARHSDVGNMRAVSDVVNVKLSTREAKLRLVGAA